MSISDSDKAILREVGKRVAEIAADPVQGENIELWKRLNRLERTRPMIMLYDWTQHETGLKFELACEGDEARAVVVTHGLKGQPHLGVTYARLAPLGDQDLSDSPE